MAGTSPGHDEAGEFDPFGAWLQVAAAAAQCGAVAGPVELLGATKRELIGTLFDVYSIGALAEELFPGAGKALAELWRDRQIDYTRIRTLSGRYADFWSVTGDALNFACDRLGLALTPDARACLMDQYARLGAFPENLGVLESLRRLGLPLAILSNGTPAMIASAVSAAGMDGLLDHILSADSVRQFKTAPEAYQLGPDAFGCPAGEILCPQRMGCVRCDMVRLHCILGEQGGSAS